MQLDRLATSPSSEPDDELTRLVVDFKAARDSGDRSLALRYIDRAWRIYSDSPEINHLYGQALVEDSPGSALPFLAKAAENRSNAGFEAAFIQALAAKGEAELAIGRLEAALRTFAVAPGGALARTAGRIVRMHDLAWAGWTGIAPDLKMIGEIIGAKGLQRLTVRDPLGATARDHLINAGVGDAAPFSLKPRQTWQRRAVEATAMGLPLLGSPVVFPPAFNLDARATLADDKLTGWVSIGWSNFDSIQILIIGQLGFRLHIATTPDLLDPGLHRFAIDLATCANGGNQLNFWAMLPDGGYARFPDTPLLIAAPPPPRARPVYKPERKNKQKRETYIDLAVVDIIIPVYRGVEETVACIQSVIDTVVPAGMTGGGTLRAEIVVINDASPDPEMGAALQTLAAEGKITLLRNMRNAGFPKTVNRGFALHRDRDVVVLNSDTEVYANWLERLRVAAYSEDDIGSVTPLTNAGSIASYPKSEDDCSSGEAAARDKLASTTNARRTVEIPTGVGFCLYFRRTCLEQTGYFDVESFRKGYGEENDLCLRAAALGWRHVLAADIYVRHIGARSFGGRRRALFERNNRLINMRYPGYDATIQDFLTADPAHDVRRDLDRERLVASAGHHILLVTLALEGGVRRAVRERGAHWQEQGLSPITLKPLSEGDSRCCLVVGGDVYDDMIYDLPAELPALASLLSRLRIDAVELHHFLGLSPELIEQLFELGCPVDVWAHDYAWYCPRITLLGAGNVYCGEPELLACEACIVENGSTLGEDISVADLRQRSAAWLSRAREVVVPSASLAQRLWARFPAIAPRVLPLEPPVEPTPTRRRRTGQSNGKLKVAVIGAIGVQKGYDVLLAAAVDAASRYLPIEYVVVGYTKDDKALRDTGKAFITGEYEEAEIAGLIDREKPDVALFISIFPETWCYTLTHAFRAGLPVAAFDFGAVGERLHEADTAALLFPLSTTPDKLNDGLLNAFDIVLPKPHSISTALVRATSPGSLPVGSRSNESARLSPVAIKPLSASIEHNIRALPLGVQPSRAAMAQKVNGLSASSEILPMVKGLYLFSVRTSGSQRMGDDHELVLPALQVGLGPGTPTDHVEFMYGPRTDGPWLCEARDHIVVKVKAPSTIILLTSLYAPGMVPLEIDVRRLDGPSNSRSAPAAQQRAPEPPPQQAARAPLSLPVPREPLGNPPGGSLRPIRLRITAHVQNRGDMVFSESQWAGMTGQRLAIESLSILPLDELTPEMIEYKAVTANGIETSWISGGKPCGTRGRGLPLIGFAIRINQNSGMRNYHCEYGAVMISGAMLGPARDGAPCRSLDVGDPIEAVWVSIGKTDAVQSGFDDLPIKSGSWAEPGEQKDPAPEQRERPPEQRERAPIGPRFSVFRDPVE